MRISYSKTSDYILVFVAIFGLFNSFSLQAAKLSSDMYSPTNAYLGKVTFEDSQHGLVIHPHISGIPAGNHGFHIHEHPDCRNHGMNAGGHYDPKQAHSHQGPYGNGHLGDLPLLVADKQGEANMPLLAPRLHTKDLEERTVMIHAGGDNYSDDPAMGGGGERIGCGRIVHARR